MGKTLGLFAVCCLALASSAFAQVDGPAFASALRAKYGPPLARETFAGRPGIEMIVDYGANGHVCRIQLPPMGPGREFDPPGMESTQAVDDFLLDLVPLTMRGKELQHWHMAAGLHFSSIVEYENITIAESLLGATRTGITVTFRNEECRKQAGQ